MKIERIVFPLAAMTMAVSTLQAELNVVATMPDLGALAQAIGGSQVEVTSLTRSAEDPHYVDPRPSFIRTLNQADVLIEGGADLEIGWLPPLVRSARNRDILPGESGYVDASAGLAMLDVPQGPLDRSRGDVHAKGNPHYLLDPLRARQVAETIAKAFTAVDAGHRDVFQKNLQSLEASIDSKLEQWQAAMKPFEGTRVVTYHKTFDYLLERFGSVLVDTLEPVPGSEPSPTHINQLIPRMKSESVKLVIVENNRPRKTPEFVAEKSGATLVRLPHFPGDEPGTDTYVAWMDHLISTLENALKDR